MAFTTPVVVSVMLCISSPVVSIVSLSWMLQEGGTMMVSPVTMGASVAAPSLSAAPRLQPVANAASATRQAAA